MALRYLHLRRSKVLANGKVRIENFGGATLAFEVTEAGVFVAVARCNDKDNFNKRLGRLISSNRFNKGLINKVDECHQVVKVEECIINWYRRTYGN